MACTSDPPSARTPTKDERLQQEAAIREEALLQLYAAAILAFPSLAPELQPLSDQHVAHRRALGAGPLPTPSATAEPVLVGRRVAVARKNLAALVSGTGEGHAAAVSQ
ncbi:MAG: hypothetical protein JWM40_3028, partial [Frankiales bacterium]|nr:hypothetical protein [Frankiales bacterium]